MLLSETTMSEAEVSLRLAFHLLSCPIAAGTAVVAIDGAQARVHGQEVFPITEFLVSQGWEMSEQMGKNSWQGRYQRGPQTLKVTAQSGRGDVVAEVDVRRIRAECKKGPVIRKPGNPEYPLLREAIGQLMTVEQVEPNDVLVVAVPQTTIFRNLVERWRGRPMLHRTGIFFALVGRDGSVEGLPDV